MDSSVIIVNRLLAGRPEKSSSISGKDKGFSFFESSKTDSEDGQSSSY